MTTTGLKAFSIPAETTKIFSAVEKRDFSYSFKTGTVAKVLSGGWFTCVGAVMATPTAIFADVLVALPVSLGMLSFLSFSVGGTILIADEYARRRAKSTFADIQKSISHEDWKEEIQNSGHGIRMKSTSKKISYKKLLSPQRLFKNVVLNETLWYSPTEDVYTQQTVYLTRGEWLLKTEKFAGRRHVFQQALKSL